MNTMGISTDPTLLDVELPSTLLESPSVSTFLPEEEASIYPLLSNTNGSNSSPLTFSHPLTPCADLDRNDMEDVCNGDTKIETRSSSGSSSGIEMDVSGTTSTTLFNKHAYHHLQLNNGTQETNGHVSGGTLSSKDTPSFVSWNWPLIRKTTFFVFMSSLLAMCALVVSMVVTLPKTCNPKAAWYRGSVFYEIFPASFQDSDNDGFGDIRGITNRMDYFVSLNIGAIRLNSIFPSANYPEDYENVTSLTTIVDGLGVKNDIYFLAEALHAHNMSLILDLPLSYHIKDLDKVQTPQIDTSNNQINITEPVLALPVTSDNPVTKAMQMWLNLGVDGFYIKGLEHFANTDDLVACLSEWKRIMGANRVIIVDEVIFNTMELSKRAAILSLVDLVDVHLDVLSGTKKMEKRINEVLSGDLAPTEDGVWIHWSLGSVEKERLTGLALNPNITLAAIVMELMLPGTPSIFYGDEIALAAASDPHKEHLDTKHLHHLAIMQFENRTDAETLSWLPQSSLSTFENYELIAKMIALRDRSPSLYAICKSETKLPKTLVRHNFDDILLVERVYPRRNSFLSISNFGQKSVKMDMSSMYYSGIVMVSKTRSEKVYFNVFEIGPQETIVVKLDK